MHSFGTLQELYTYVKSDLDDTTLRPATVSVREPEKPKAKLRILFACNTSGKTRLATAFQEESQETEVEEDKKEQVLCYNAFFEDYFHWDNENLVLLLDKNSWVSQLIEDEGLEPDIEDNFKKLTSSKVEPEFEFDKGIISFGFLTGDDNKIDKIKISRGEESLFIWCVFYTILERAIELLSENPEERSTNIFDDIKYIVIDDPVSSMDDNRIITLALDLVQLIELISKLDNKLNILITTHHCLFYNILHSTSVDGVSIKKYLLEKKEDNTLSLTTQNKDSPFAYHLILLKEIKKAVDSDNIKKYHCNFFRAILEKTANFLGYVGGWRALLPDDANREHIAKLLNTYSHNSLAEIEDSSLQLAEKELFKTAFSTFFAKFNWSCSND